MDIRNFSRSPSALAASASASPVASSSVSIEMRNMSTSSRATSGSSCGRNPQRCSQPRTRLSQTSRSRRTRQNALGRRSGASPSNQRPSSHRRASRNASTSSTASAPHQLDQRQTLLTCQRCLCLRAPQSACCGSVLEKGIRSLVAACMCIHGTAILIRVIEITLSGSSPEITPFNFVCITPTSMSIVAVLSLLRLGWVAVCALVCVNTRSDDADLRSRNTVMTTFFFSAIAFALVMAADGLYTDLFGLGSCEPIEDTSANSSIENPGAAPTLIPESVTGIDIAYTVIITLFQLVLQGYCSYAAWGYLVALNRTQSRQANQPRRGATNENQDVVMGQLVNLDTLEGQPVEVASLVVALPRCPDSIHRSRRGRGGNNRNFRNVAQQTSGSASISPSPVLARSNFLRDSAGCTVAVATKLRRASEADMTDVPAAIVVGGGGSKEPPASSVDINVSDTPDSLEQASEPRVAPARPQQAAEEGPEEAAMPAHEAAVSATVRDSNDSDTDRL